MPDRDPTLTPRTFAEALELLRRNREQIEHNARMIQEQQRLIDVMGAKLDEGAAIIERLQKAFAVIKAQLED